MNINRKFILEFSNFGFTMKSVCRNPILYNTWEWTARAVHAVSLSVYTSPWGLCWDFRGLEDTRWIFRVRTDYLIPTLMPKQSQRNLCWRLLGSIPVFFIPWKCQLVPILSQPLVGPGKRMLRQLPLTFTFISRICWCNGNSCPNPTSRCQLFCFLDFRHHDSIFTTAFPYHEVWESSAISDIGQLPGQGALKKLGSTCYLF